MHCFSASLSSTCWAIALRPALYPNASQTSFAQNQGSPYCQQPSKFAGKKKNYGKAISSFPFIWLYFIIRIYEYDIKVKSFFLLAAIIMENVKFYPHLVADYVKYMLKITFDLYCLWIDTKYT